MIRRWGGIAFCGALAAIGFACLEIAWREGVATTMIRESAKSLR